MNKASVQQLDNTIRELQDKVQQNDSVGSEKLTKMTSFLADFKGLEQEKIDAVNSNHDISGQEAHSRQATLRLIDQKEQERELVLETEQQYEQQMQFHKRHQEREQELERKQLFFYQEELNEVLKQQDKHQNEAINLHLESIELSKKIARLQRMSTIDSSQATH